MTNMIETQVAEFAKTNRVSKVKLLDFVKSLMVNKNVRTYSKADAVTETVVMLANENGGKVSLTELRKMGIENAAYVTKVMVSKNILKPAEYGTKPAGRGRPSATFELV